MHIAVSNAEVMDIISENSYLSLNVGFPRGMIKCPMKRIFEEGISSRKD